MSYRRFANGWLPGTGTWTYASATTMTVPTSDAANMDVGTRLWLNQSGSKYFVVVGVSGTTITLTGGTTYTLANAAITLPYYSNDESPNGYPHWFAFASTVTAAGGTFTTVASTGRFCVSGRSCTYTQTVVTTTVGTATTATVTTLPVAASANAVNVMAGAGVETNNTGDALVGRITGTNALSIRNYINGFDGANNAQQRVTITYEI